MARLDQLPPDQRAVLQLLLKQGKSYGEIADLLKIERSAVKARAHDALAALGPEDTEDLSEDRRDEIGDYLLGQQDEGQQAATRSFLASSPSGRAWARVVSSELRELKPDGLPEIPAEGAAEVTESEDALEARRAARSEQERSSKLGGILLIGGVAIAAIVVLVLLLTGGGDNNKKDTGPVGSTTTTPTNTSTTPQVEAQINLFPPGGGKKPLGVANVVTQSGQRGIALVGQDVPPTGGKFAYAMWLENSPSSAKRLGFFGAVTKNGRLQGFVIAPSDFGNYSKLVVTRETQRNPKVPGPVVLSGNLKQ
jgi:sigma-70-like protein